MFEKNQQRSGTPTTMKILRSLNNTKPDLHRRSQIVEEKDSAQIVLQKILENETENYYDYERLAVFFPELYQKASLQELEKRGRFL